MKICLIEECLLTRCAYVDALNRIECIESVADFSTLADCENYLTRTGADAVLVDVELTDKEMEIIKHLKQRFRDLKIIVMAQQDEVLPILALGAAYVLKDFRMEEFVEIIATILHGNLFIAADIVGLITSIFQEKVDNKTQIESFHLTQREKEVLFLVAKGESNAQIGAELFLSAFTVKNYVSRIIEKMGVKDRTQATAKAIQCGLV